MATTRGLKMEGSDRRTRRTRKTATDPSGGRGDEKTPVRGRGGQARRAPSGSIRGGAFPDGPARLARILLELAGAPASATELPPPGAILPDRIKQGELASLVGATRESVQKWLASFWQPGCLPSGAKLGAILISPAFTASSMSLAVAVL